MRETASVPSIVGTVAPETRRGGLDVLRDIVRGGLAGLMVGIVVAGIGGRLVMRLAALLVPDADRAFTENGNRIGDITVGGTVTLVVLGLLFGAIAGSLWVAMRTFLPRGTPARALLSIPIALALGTTFLIDPGNRDFDVLGHDPLVVASLVLLVAAFGPGLVIADAWLDRRLPRPMAQDRRTIGIYTTLLLIGLPIFLLIGVPAYLGPRLLPVGIALGVVGVATLATWWDRIRGAASASDWPVGAGRLGLAGVVVMGAIVVVPDVLAVLRP